MSSLHNDSQRMCVNSDLVAHIIMYLVIWLDLTEYTFVCIYAII